MDSVIELVTAHAYYAHWIVFGVFLLGGLNIPISEDLLIIISGMLAATVVPENVWKLFVAVFLGAYLSDWMCYWLGRKLGPKLLDLSWFAKRIKKEKIDQIQAYYKNYGFLTLLIGRFIPFGVRNMLFLTAGIGRMPFKRFILSDGVACLTSNTTLFTLSFYAGKNVDSIMHFVKTFNLVIFSTFCLFLMMFFWYKGRSKTLKKNDESI
jgi:membrane-associated protein